MKKVAKITALSTLVVLCLCGLTLRQAQDTAFDRRSGHRLRQALRTPPSTGSGHRLRQAQDTAFAGALPDTGQTKCYNDTAEITCPAPGEDFYGQDAQYVTNPRSYTKLDASGNDLSDSATSWTMVRDNVTDKNEDCV